MPRILVTPGLLIDLSQQMSQSAGQLRDIDSQLGRALGGLEWEARQQAHVDGQVNSARSQARSLAEQADKLARYLVDRAQAFLDADRDGTSSLGSLNTYTKELMLASRSSPESAASAYLKLGEIGHRAKQEFDEHGAKLADWAGYFADVIPFAVLMGMMKVDANGVAHVFGSQVLKEWAGVSSHLTYIRPGNLASHMVGQTMDVSLKAAFSPLANAQTALGLVPTVIEDWQKYSGEGAVAVSSAILVDSAISIVTSKAFQIGGAALGTALLGPPGTAIGYAAGGLVGKFVGDWISSTPARDFVVDKTREGMTIIQHGVQDTVQQAYLQATSEISW